VEISPSVRDFRSLVARFVDLTLFRLRALFLCGDDARYRSTAWPVVIALRAIVFCFGRFARFTRLKFLRRVMPAQMVGGVTCPPKNRPAEM